MWPSNAPFNPFVNQDDQVESFCSAMASQGVVIYNGDPVGLSAPGSCAVYIETAFQGDPTPAWQPLALGGYGLSIAVVFDYNGCASPTDSHRTGINFTSYGVKKCHNTFMDKVVNKCKKLFCTCLTCIGLIKNSQANSATATRRREG